MCFSKIEQVSISASVRYLAILKPASVHRTMAVNSEIVILFAAGVAEAILISCHLSSQVAPNCVFEADAELRRASVHLHWPRRSTRR